MSNENDEGSEESGAVSETGKDIKIQMDRYQAKMKLGEKEETSSPPEGDSTRSEE